MATGRVPVKAVWRSVGFASTPPERLYAGQLVELGSAIMPKCRMQVMAASPRWAVLCNRTMFKTNAVLDFERGIMATVADVFRSSVGLPAHERSFEVRMISDAIVLLSLLESKQLKLDASNAIAMHIVTVYTRVHDDVRTMPTSPRIQPAPQS